MRPNRRFRRRAPRSKRSTRKPNRKRRSNPLRSSTTTPKSIQSGLGTLVARGLRSIVSMLPGSGFVLPMVDFVFNNLLYSDVKPTNGRFVGQVRTYGLTSALDITRANIVGSSLTQRQRNYWNDYYFFLEYQDVKIDSLKIVIQPDNKLSTRTGFITVGFQPLANEVDVIDAEYFIDKDNIDRCLLNMSGPFDKPFVLTYTPQSYDGASFGFWPILDAKHKTTWYLNKNYWKPTVFGNLYINYENPNREVWTEISTSEIGFNIQLIAKYELRNPVPRNLVYGPDSFNFCALDKIRDRYKESKAVIIDKSRRCTVLKNDSSYKCEPDTSGKFCTVSANVLRTDHADKVSNDFEMI